MRRSLTLAFLTAALASVPLVPSVARADDAAIAEAKKRFDEGLELADSGKHEPARLKFQQAWSVFKAPAVLYNLARAEQLTGHELEALEHFKLFLKVAASDVKVTDTMRDKAKLNVSELTPKVGQVDIDVPPTARVTVDGKPLEETPREPVPVQPGRHRIEATFEGKVKSISVDCAAGGITKAKIDFEVGGAITEPPHEVGGKSSWSTGRIVTVGALSAGAIAGGVLALVFHGAAQSNVEEAQGLLNGGSCIGVTAPQCSKAATLKDDRDSNVTLSTVSLIAGGTLAVGAVAAAVFWPKGSKEVGRITPMVAPGFGGATLGGTF